MLGTLLDEPSTGLQPDGTGRKEAVMVRRFVDYALRYRTHCRHGHLWTERARPVACSRCGRIRRLPIAA
jgi:hypothetical protein